jgi:AraC-like DNA-binding protein
MSESSDIGVLYTDHSDLRGRAPIASLWSYDTHVREPNRRSVTKRPSGAVEYWLDRSDPLLNTMLPGTHVSFVVNLGDDWSAGRTFMSAELLSPVSVMGPSTWSRILYVGRFVRAVGCVIPPTLADAALGVPASELADRIVPLRDLWPADDVARLFEAASRGSTRSATALVRDAVMHRLAEQLPADPLSRAAADLIAHRGGRVSIHALARRHALSRRQFTRRFTRAAGLSPKLFARLSRFQRLVHGLLSTDVSRWASMSSAVGFYDQSHMINDFRELAGCSPTTFFQPHGGEIDPGRVRLRGRPSEWLRPN